MSAKIFIGGVDFAFSEIKELIEEEMQQLQELAEIFARQYGMNMEEARSVARNLVGGPAASSLEGELLELSKQTAKWMDDSNFPKNREQRRKEARLQKKLKRSHKF